MNLTNFLKSYKKLSYLVLFTTIITVLVVFLILYIFIYRNKSNIFNYFASHYLENIQNDKTNKEYPRNILSQETTIIDVVEKVNPAVVSIVITKDVPIIEEYFENYSPFNDFFNNPFGGYNFQVPRYKQNGTKEQEIGGGSGFFVTKDGLVVTNKHVVTDKDATYTVLTNNGEKFDAEVLARDPVLDIAILKTNAKNTTYLTFSNSDTVKLGQIAIAIGNALGEFRNSISVGVVSGLSRSVNARDGFGNLELLEEVIQTDAAINPGNSGGPLIDSNGNVIGVNVAVAQGSENIGFALPANIVSKIVDSVKKYGEIVRPYIGVRYIHVNETIKEKNNLSVDYGALVLRGQTQEELAIIPGSPADKAGILENDIILEVNGKKIDQDNSLNLIIRKYNVGDTVNLKILSKGKEKTTKLTLEKAPNDI